MSAQINLYHSRFLKQHDPLTLRNVAISAAILYVVLAAISGWTGKEAATRKAVAAGVEEQLDAVRNQVTAANEAATTRKPSPELAADIENAETLLRRRDGIARLLESGVVGNTDGFAEYLRGFARQIPAGLWLTGFTIESGGSDMEIRGSMLDPATLPIYIHRLGSEKAFQGRSFAALTMERAEPVPVAASTGQGVAVAPGPTIAQLPVDFVLMPKLIEAREAGK
jgi:hypothetical protein